MELDVVWLKAHWEDAFICVLFTERFMNNLLERMPSLKSNTCFEVVHNTLDALIATVKGKKGAENES